MLAKKVKLHWLNLGGLGLSAIERLLIEEILLRHDDRSWALVGTHEPANHKYLRDKSSETKNSDCIIVMGIGGKPEKLLNMEAVRRDEVTVIQRFSGGGTVVLDTNSLWTTLIGRKDDFPSVEAFPRPIMQWSAEAIFGPAFKKLNQQLIQKHLKTGGKRTLVVDSKSCSNDNSGRVITLENGHLEIPEFALRENDYILGDRKMGGNAQCIIKDAWLHHTSFLWDFDSDIMNYLTLPDKRPAYRQDRSHDDFLVRLKDVYQGLQQRHFVASLQEASADEFDLQPVSLQEVMTTVKGKVGGLQEWLDTKSRTKVVTS